MASTIDALPTARGSVNPHGQFKGHAEHSHSDEERVHHSTASSVMSTGVTMVVSPVSLSVVRNALRV